VIEPAKLGEADCAYLAALLDNAASVEIKRGRRGKSVYRTLLLSISGLKGAAAKWLLEKFGPGHCYQTPEGMKVTYVTRRAAEVCVHAYPHLQAFKEHARLVTRFASSLGSFRTPLTPENVAIRVEVDRELQALQRGAKRGR